MIFLELQNKLREFCAAGGNLFVSGAFIASDMNASETDRRFVRDVLHCEYAGSVTDISKTDIIGNKGVVFRIPRTVNEECYAVSCPDVLAPMKDSFVTFVYDGVGDNSGAAVAYNGKNRVVAASFPFEAIQGEKKRAELMGAVMRFFGYK